MDLITANITAVTPQMIEWMDKGDNNYFDPMVLQYPSTQLIVARTAKKDILYMPVQTALVLESLAINPDATKHEIAVAIRTIITSLGLIAQKAGIGEFYFLGSNEKTNEFANKQDGFTQSRFPVFRAKTFQAPSVTNENIPQVSS